MSALETGTGVNPRRPLFAAAARALSSPALPPRKDRAAAPSPCWRTRRRVTRAPMISSKRVFEERFTGESTGSWLIVVSEPLPSCGDADEGLFVCRRIPGEEGERLALVTGGVQGKERVASGRAEHAAGFHHHGGGAGHVPQRRAVIVHERQRAQRDVAELQRGGSEPAQAVTPHPALDKWRDALRPRRPDREERAVGQGRRLHAEAAAIAPGSLPCTGGEELVRHWIVDGARQSVTPAQDAHGDAEAGYPSPEVVGTVHRVQHPHVLRIEPARHGREPFLAED